MSGDMYIMCISSLVHHVPKCTSFHKAIERESYWDIVKIIKNIAKNQTFSSQKLSTYINFVQIKTHFEKRKREREEYQIELNSSHQHHFPSVQKHTYTFAETNSYYIKVPNYDPTKGLVKKVEQWS